jgi:AraC family transcriptional regulator
MDTILKPGRYYGELSKSRDIGGALLTETIYPVGYRTPRHLHERAYFSFVLQGGGDQVQNGDPKQSAALMFHPPGVLHNGQVRRDGGRSFFVEIAPTLLERVKDQIRFRGSSISFHGGLTNRLVARLYREFRQMDEASPLAIEGLVLEMLAQCSQVRAKPATSQIPRWLLNARAAMHDRYSERLTLSIVANLAGVHPVYFATQFRRFYHCSVGDYVRRIRIEAACRELAHSNGPLAEIAATLGFAHQAHFSRTFKDHMGQTPSGYRNTFRNDSH